MIVELSTEGSVLDWSPNQTVNETEGGVDGGLSATYRSNLWERN